MASPKNENSLKDLRQEIKNVSNIEEEQAQKKDNAGDVIIPVHKQLSDVAQFSYAALCATALHSLFEGDADGKFREETLALILIALEQPQQVCESVRAMLQGQGLDDMDPYIDILLAEEALKDGAEPIISQLLAIGIGQGCYDARMRVLIKHLAWRLKVGWDTVDDLEIDMSETLALSQYEMSEDRSWIEQLEEKIGEIEKRKEEKVQTLCSNWFSNSGWRNSNRPDRWFSRSISSSWGRCNHWWHWSSCVGIDSRSRHHWFIV
ncbi:Transmembrane and coiled-coil domain-containing protein 4 [Bulinus truncatus]|nr:Transmembrane and coiled-coil domain-containing protein 4 [Bulinus truncatus]